MKIQAEEWWEVKGEGLPIKLTGCDIRGGDAVILRT